MKRMYFHIALIASMLFLPWYVTALLLIAACFSISAFYESVIYGILIDSFYGSPFGIYGHSFIWTLGSVIVFGAASLIRTRLLI